MRMNKRTKPPRAGTNLSVSVELIEEARALGINLSREAENGIAKAVSEEKARRWKEENAEAIEGANRYLAEHGLPFAKYRVL